MRHLIAYGHRRILHITWFERRTIQRRGEAYQAALAEAGIPYEPQLVVEVEISMIDILVIGTVSLDTLHLADGRTVQTLGGAGLYTALAAQRMGGDVGLFGPKPEPLPAMLAPVARRLHWMGPLVPPELLPRLEIEHQGRGRATLIGASWGAEAQLVPQALPEIAGQSRIAHIAALSTTQRQLDFGQALAEKSVRISAGTYARLVYEDTARVRQLFELADLFFMNENEAKGLFGSVSRARTRLKALLFVTLDAEGALVIEGERLTHVPGHPVAEVDPTGAGDTFCGATLAGLVNGLSPVKAASEAVKLAAQVVSTVGPQALLKPHQSPEG